MRAGRGRTGEDGAYHMQLAFAEFDLAPQAAALSEPQSYRGLYAFHKYWGKKPAEPIRYLVQHLCPRDGLVVDPFLGSGISAIEAVQLRRRMIGIDVIPAVRLARLLVAPPSVDRLQNALKRVAATAEARILQLYDPGREGGNPLCLAPASPGKGVGRSR